MSKIKDFEGVEETWCEPCNQCGLDAQQFREGVCLWCYDDNQAELNQHNAELDAWAKMTDKQKDDAIKAGY